MTAAAVARAPVAQRRAVAVLLAGLVATSLLAGLLGGLLRAGVPLAESPGALAGRAAVFHAALMLGGFFGTVIGVERAVALKSPAAFVAPLASGLGGVLLLAGQPASAGAALAVAALGFLFVNVAIVRRQAAAHTLLLLFAACAWLVGNVLFALGRTDLPVVAWWFLFIAATIAAERLELTRLAPRPGYAPALLFGVLALGAAAAALGSTGQPIAAGVLYGGALAALAAWFGAFDIARRTLFTHGLSRYMAVCLLGGYAWLAVAGAAWSATALGAPLRDAALHALGLGFIVSMVMGHAPVILPAVTGIKVDFSAALYAPLALLHVSLLLRLASATTHTVGAALNAAAFVLFALTMAAAALRRRARRPSSP